VNINFDCPQCGQNLEAPNDMAGMELDCPSCSAQMRIPTFDPQGNLGAATLVASQPKLEPEPVLDPPQRPVQFKLRQVGEAAASGAEMQCPNCKQGLGSGAVLCVHCGYDFRNRRSPRTGTMRGGEAGGPAVVRVASVVVAVLVVIAGAFFGYRFVEKRNAAKRAAALRAQEEEAETRRLAEEAEARRLAEEKARLAEEERLRQEAALKAEEERLAQEQAAKRREYEAKALFLNFSPWSSQAGSVVSAKMQGYGDLWVVLNTKAGDILAVERGKLSAHDQERLREADAILKAGTAEWDEYARNMAATRGN